MEVVGWENVDYGADLEPAALKWRRCGVCSAAWAEVQCQTCNLQLCRACDASVHSALSDPESHQDIGPCNACQDCHLRGHDFYCRDCDRHQCERCCAAAHKVSDEMRAHVWHSTEGALMKHFRHTTWSDKYKAVVKLKRREALQARDGAANVVKREAGALSDYIPLPRDRAADDDDEATSDEGEPPQEAAGAAQRPTTTEAVQIKMERVRLHDTETPAPSAPVEKTSSSHSEADVAEQDIPVKTERVPEPPVQVKSEQTQQPPKARSSRAVEIVDLTEDDDDETAKMPSSDGHVDAAASAIKTEVHAASAGGSTETAMPSFASLSDDDSIRTIFIEEYDKQSKTLHDTQQHIARVTQRAASGSFQDMRECKQQLEVLRNVLAKHVHSRNAAAARLLVYLRGESAEFAALLATTTAEIPEAQAAIHRRLAELRAEIERSCIELQARKTHMDEAIRMKSGDAYAEVRRLGAEIAALESGIRALETQRLEGLEGLCHVSQQVRAAALAMLANTSAHGDAQ